MATKRVRTEQAELIDFVEVQHQDTEKELRRELEVQTEYVRQLRVMLRAFTDGIQANDRRENLLVLSLKARELLGIPAKSLAS